MKLLLTDDTREYDANRSVEEIVRKKVCVIGFGCARGDGISSAIAADCEALLASVEIDPFFIGRYCDIDIPHFITDNTKSYLYNPRFAEADIRLFHFGYFDKFINALVLRDGSTRTIVRFHNVTPPEFVAAGARDGILRSLHQVGVLAQADEIWPVSDFNRRILADMGHVTNVKKTLPVAIDKVARRVDPREKSGPIKITFVGRVVQSKGVHVLVEAFELLKKQGHSDIELHIVGNMSADKRYARQIRERIQSKLRDSAQIHGKVSAAELGRIYEMTSILAIPSFHEGFCIPVIEGLNAGAVPVVSNTAALPDTLNGFGVLSPVGDAAAFAGCLEKVIVNLRDIRRRSPKSKIVVERGALDIDSYQQAVSRYVESFSPKVVGDDLVSRVLDLARNRNPMALAKA